MSVPRTAVFLAVLAVTACSEPFTEPDLSSLADGVRETIEQAQTRFHQAIRDPDTDHQAAEAWGDLCRVYHAHHLLDSAAACYRRAIHAGRGDYRWHYYLAHALRDLGQPVAAEDRFREVLALEPGYGPAQYHLAKMLIDRGDAAGALELLRKLEAKQPGAAVLAAIGQAAMLEGDYAGASRALEGALAMQPDATRLHYLAAMAARGLGDSARAGLHLNRAGNVDPRFDDPLIGKLAALSRSAELLLERGRAALAQGDTVTAEREFRNAIEFSPDDASAHATLALLLQQTARPAEAIDKLIRATELDPGNATYHFLAGTAHERGGREDAAVAAYRRSVELDPAYAEPRVLLGHAAMRRGDYTQALEHYSIAANTLQQSVVARYHAGLAASAAGDCETATRVLDAALQRQQTYGPAIMALVRARAVCGGFPVADNLQLARELFNAAPDNDDVRATLAMALAAAGRFDEAADLQPDHGIYLVDKERYRRGEMPPAPWPDGAAVYRPSILSPQ